jgi:lipid-binding SYLF domain-containing protein
MAHFSSFYSFCTSNAKKPKFSRLLSRSATVLGIFGYLTTVGCLRQTSTQTPSGVVMSPQQIIIENSAEAVSRLRNGKHRTEFEANLKHAKAILVFPRVVKASFVFGGEGGNGILTARRADGSWTDPAFYSIGAPSIGLQLGYQEATVALFVMDDETLKRLLDTNVEFGTNRGVTLEQSGQNDSMSGEVLARNIRQIVDADGAFAGVSLNGYVISARPKHIQAYYGSGMTAQRLLRENFTPLPNTNVLRQSLATLTCTDLETIEQAYPNDNTASPSGKT